MQKQLTNINAAESAAETSCAKKISVIDLYPDSEDSDDSNTKSSWFIGDLDDVGSGQTYPATTPKAENLNNFRSAEAPRARAPQSLLWNCASILSHNQHSFDFGSLFASEKSQTSLAGGPTPNVSRENLTRTPSEEQIMSTKLPSKPIDVNPNGRATRQRRKF